MAMPPRFFSCRNPCFKSTFSFLNPPFNSADSAPGGRRKGNDSLRMLATSDCSGCAVTILFVHGPIELSPRGPAAGAEMCLAVKCGPFAVVPRSQLVECTRPNCLKFRPNVTFSNRKVLLLKWHCPLSHCLPLMSKGGHRDAPPPNARGELNPLPMSLVCWIEDANSGMCGSET